MLNEMQWERKQGGSFNTSKTCKIKCGIWLQSRLAARGMNGQRPCQREKPNELANFAVNLLATDRCRSNNAVDGLQRLL